MAALTRLLFFFSFFSSFSSFYSFFYFGQQPEASKPKRFIRLL